MLCVAVLMSAGMAVTQAETWVPIKGDVQSADGTPVCAMVLANGQYMFSCDGTGGYDLGVPLDDQGQVTLFAFADGFAPFGLSGKPSDLPYTIQMAEPSQDDSPILMSREVQCTDTPYLLHLTGSVTSSDGQPLCALVLSNGQHQFSCVPDLGVFDLTVPLDIYGDVDIFGFADRFQPYHVSFVSPDCGYSATSSIDRTKSNWYVVSSTSALDGSKSYTLGISALGSPGGEVSFRIYCDSNGQHSYTIKTNFVTGSGYIRYRIGTNFSKTTTWNESPSSGYTTLYPSAFDWNLMKELYNNWDFVVELDRYAKSSSTFSMSSSGLSAALDRTRDACTWSEDILPRDNGWGKRYPETPPSNAKEAIYNANANEQFGLVAWIANNIYNRPQLLVRVGEPASLCKGPFLIDNKRLYVTQDGIRVSAVSGTDFQLSCGKTPATFALTGDYDVSKPFTLEAYPFHFSSLNPGVPISSVSFY